MLSPINNTTIISSHNLFRALVLLCSLQSAGAYAEIDEEIRQEPILPIPLVSEADSKKADLGEKLFFDLRLSSNSDLACSSCHQLDAGGDDNVTSRNIINTPTIFNVKYNFRQNWDGSVKTLGEQIDLAVRNHNVFKNSWDDIIATLSQDHELNEDFLELYLDGITRENIIDALVEFENTLTTPNSRFDKFLRYENNALSAEEIRGYEVFKKLGCISCHQGINVGGNLYQKFGVFYNYIAERGEIKKTDYGRMNITNRQMDAFVFKVPSLRNIAVTAPYLHDGSAQTLEEAIIIMGRTQLGRTLTTEQTLSIKAFLNTLTGEYKNIPLDDPS
ncbi:MAG: c-type cytochrome [Gammaproteobacteria bacterium]|jgi:cytochrome c peroxidase|nr:c-type cytochrome [Gammaproteobacteria bacterium]